MKKLLLIASVAMIAFNAQSQTLVGRWKFDGNTNDASPNGLTGYAHGGTTYTTGYAGVANTAIHLNGTSGYVAVPSNSLLNLTTWSIQALIKVDHFNNNLCQGNSVVWRGAQYGLTHYDLQLTDNIYDNSCNIYTPSKTGVYAGGAGTVSNAWTLGNYLDSNRWYCLTATYSHDTVKVYIDGVLTQTNFNNTSYSPYSTSDSLFIGVSNNPFGSYPYFLNGSIDEVSLWNGALSASAITNQCDSAKCSIKDISFCGSAANPGSFTFTPTGVNPANATVNWTFGDGTTTSSIGSIPVTHTYSGSNSYTVCASVMQYVNGKQATCSSFCFNICVSSGGITSKNTQDNMGGTSLKSNANIKLSAEQIQDPYPNPASDVLYVPVSGDNSNVTVIISTIDGKSITSKTERIEGKGVLNLSMSGLPAGLYYIQIKDAAGNRTKTLTKQ